jgi:type I restriction enzyme S subunit
MEKYQSYKSSGIEWLGDIPSSWGISKIKFCNQIVSSNIDKKEYEGYEKHLIIHYNDVIKNKKIYINNITEFGYCSNTQFQSFKVSKGDIILTKDSMDVKNICDSSIILDDLSNCVFGYHLYKLTSNKEKLNPNYFYHFLNNKNVKNYFLINSNGTTIIGVSKTSLENTPLILPPLHEQHQIVQYLDEKTELIDKLISTKERKINLLKEQRTSLINQVVTKGLNPNVKMKESFVEWIGDIPEGWIVGKLKHNSELKISSVDKHVYDDEIQVTVCNYTDVYYNEFITTNLEMRKGSCTIEEFNKYKLKKGDVIITKDSESPNDIGVPSIVSEELDNVICGYHLSIIKPNTDKIIGDFLFRQLQTTRVRRYYEICSNGITRFGLGKSSVLETPLIIPPIEEQVEIVKYLDYKIKEIDDLVQLEKKNIDLLKEYRQSLISEVVTGKIKVTTDE